MRTVAVLGASGYAGGELVRMLDEHPSMELVHLGAHSRVGEPLSSVHPQLRSGDRVLGSNDPDDLPSEVDLVFLALPHGASWEIGEILTGRGLAVVDLGSDYRLDTDERYRAAYGEPHPLPHRLGEWRYGLPELFDLSGADRVASPGCYPTAVLLAIVPLIRAGLIDSSAAIVADCLSGVSGAGRSLKENLLFGAVAEGVQAYSVTRHRHRPEIEMAITAATGVDATVVFTPHLVPMQRGELATVTAPLATDATDASARRTLAEAYAGRPFVSVVDVPPQTRWAVSSNRAIVSAFVDHHAGVVIAQAAIDNLVKGAAGQAIQAANVMSGLPEETGLPLAGWMP
ncbi:MAG TPA: N-acetyl-gamma-glutamyl-phosphate reductase [Acidimicrobiia bacterium]|nr:N-acetyl-gamma-glutamyl-phosphate reductase [Acidimicrobiia bacterium]